MSSIKIEKIKELLKEFLPEEAIKKSILTGHNPFKKKVQKMSLEKLLDELEKRASGSEDPWFDKNHILQLIKACRVMREALEKIEPLTHSWVSAEQTINCKHTYQELREISKQALAEADRICGGEA